MVGVDFFSTGVRDFDCSGPGRLAAMIVLLGPGLVTGNRNGLTVCVPFEN